MVKPAWLTLIVYSFQGLWNMGASPYIHSEQLKTFNYAMSQVLNGGVLRQGASAAAAVVQMMVPIIVFAASQSQICLLYTSIQIVHNDDKIWTKNHLTVCPILPRKSKI